MNSFRTMRIALALLLFTACQNGSDADKKNDTTKTVTPVATVTKPVYELVMWHKVADFDKWLKSYESAQGDSVRAAYGIHSHVVGRDSDDPNMILVVVMADDLAKAKAFAASPDLKKAMEKSGAGKPSMMLVNRQMIDSTTDASTNRVMIMHKVKDFDAWKKAFDEDKKMRTDAGIADRALGYSVDDKNDVFLVFAVTDVKKAKAFTSSKTLQDKMTAAGVTGKPEMHFYTVAKKW